MRRLHVHAAHSKGVPRWSDRKVLASGSLGQPVVVTGQSLWYHEAARGS